MKNGQIHTNVISLAMMIRRGTYYYMANRKNEYKNTLTFLYWCVLERGCRWSMSTDVMMVSCSILMTKLDHTPTENTVFTLINTPHNTAV